MPTLLSKNINRDAAVESWLGGRANASAIVVIFFGFLARLWAASGTFLNPDEALHFRLANQLSLFQAYRESLTASHPPLLTFVLYFWRAGGTSELWLRMPSVVAGATFCWMFYKWLSRSAGSLAGLIGLFFVALLSPIVALGAEIRQYALLLAFLASALYFLDEAFAKNSPGLIAAFSVCLYLAMLSHYSAFLFAAAIGVYALIRIFRDRISAKLIVVWSGGQLGALMFAIFLYKTHVAKLGAGESRTALQGWMSDFFLRHSYFDPAHDHWLTFLTGHTFGVFQYFFGQLAAGVVMGLLFVTGVVWLLRAKSLPADYGSQRRLGILLLLLFAIACCSSIAHVYPYGGTRHVAFLIIPAMVGVSVAIARFSGGRWTRALAIAGIILIACIAFGKPRRPMMERADQSRTNMAVAMEFIRHNVGVSDLIFTDYESDLILGHYLCRQQPITIEALSHDFESFLCGYHVVSASYKSPPLTSNSFPDLWNRLIETQDIEPGSTIWIFQAGWDAGLPEDLRSHSPEFHDLQFESFGNNIKIFKLIVGRPIPGSRIN
jgi:putative effector of murein hydrolase LrgA (UPF0299 family)